MQQDNNLPNRPRLEDHRWLKIMFSCSISFTFCGEINEQMLSSSLLLLNRAGCKSVRFLFVLKVFFFCQASLRDEMRTALPVFDPSSLSCRHISFFSHSGFPKTSHPTQFLTRRVGKEKKKLIKKKRICVLYLCVPCLF